MKSFTPGLFERLIGKSAHAAFDGGVAHLSIADLKHSVARDLEALLNTRSALPQAQLSGHPECAKSVLGYGLSDFAGRSLSNGDDRAAICRSLEHAIACHEPRLREVCAALEVCEGSINRLNFAISALLVVDSAREPVNFDAILQPSSLHYTIGKARRAAAPGA